MDFFTFRPRGAVQRAWLHHKQRVLSSWCYSSESIDLHQSGYHCLPYEFQYAPVHLRKPMRGASAAHVAPAERGGSWPVYNAGN